ncbi:MAG: Cell division membrane protein FtsW [Ignavibacteria bacterium]|nr:MAG: Cell division membrane protein FtsW [Ignavibacteria bacterium]KAF0161247.1 MAG: Cell division membrane protein FtsW [Ignavibacteria bacterium]
MNTWVKILIVFVVAMISLGAVMVLTASGTYSMMKWDSNFHLFQNHFTKILIAVAGLYVFSKIKYEKYRKYTKIALFAIIAVLIYTYFYSPKIKGAQRWLDLGFIQFQPSEAAKIILIMHLSLMLEKYGEKIKDFKNGFLFPLIWVGIVGALVLVQPNVSTAVIIVITSFILLFVAGARPKHVFGILAGASFIIGAAAYLLTHSRERILTYIDSLINGGDINVQVKQAKIALGSGGWVGIGAGHSRQSDLFLPESYGDFIFSILGEEWGFIGSVTILALYFSLFLVCMVIAKKSQDKFGQLMVLGLGFNIIISAFINAAVVTGLLPTTGITLPFISFGGTSIILYAISIGIIINVGRQTVRTSELKIQQI